MWLEYDRVTNMRKVLSVDNMRKSDAATISSGIPGIELMYRAGKGIYNTLVNGKIVSLEDAKKSEVYIFCGSGNNAGDGYVLALLLKENHVPCKLVLCSNRFSEDGRYYYDKCVKKNIDIIEANDISEQSFVEDKNYVIVDCLLGTGFKGSPREPMKSIIDNINGYKADNEERITVVSVDINSGLDGDTGLYDVCVESDVTISIGDLKPGLLLNKAKDVIGEHINIDIGIEAIDKPFLLMESMDVKKCLPQRLNDSNKGTYGYIALIGGSYKYSGAIRLAAMANSAMRSGAGVVMVAAPSTVCPYIIPNILESTIYPLSDNKGEVIFDRAELDGLMGRVKVIAFGMGIGCTDETKLMLKYLLAHYVGILIIDADGLNALAGMGNKVLQNTSCRQVILTPHLKEFTRLTGRSVVDIKSDPINISKQYAKENKVILLLKGPTTIVTDGDTVYLSDRGCPGMATAGSGDVLSGILAAMCGYAEDTLLSVAAGAYINGLAGECAQDEYGDVSMLAGDTVANISKVIMKIRN